MKALRLFSLLLVILLPRAFVFAELINVEEFKIKAGDDPQWSQSAYDDSQWMKTYLMSVPPRNGVLWLRAHVVLESEQWTTGRPLGIFFAAMASHEVYWDGVLIGKGGVPGQTASQEIPGPIQSYHFVPQRLASPGVHVVALRTSAHHRHFKPVTGYWNLLIGDYDEIVRTQRGGSWISLISLSGMLLVAFFSFVLYLTDRTDCSYLVLAVLGFISSGLLIAETWRNLVGYTYNYHYLRLCVITALTALWNLCLLIFMIVRFPGTRRAIFISTIIAGLFLSLLMPGWDNKNLLMFYIGLPIAFLWTVRAALQKRKGTLPAIVGLAGTGIVLFWMPFLFSDLTLFFSVDFLLLCLLVAHALQVRQVRMERQEALLKSARLEIELLRKHIQPHFLMNTLTALAEWIEDDPQSAIKMIHSLADEFRLLSEVSSQSLISMKDEMRLCLYHLDIMSRRKGRQYALITKGIDPESKIPPAVIHTLVENAITHTKLHEPKIEFLLTSEQKNGRRYLLFEAPFDNRYPGGNIEQEGTGLRYVRARLQESYGTDWLLTTGPSEGRWKTQIDIPV